MAGTSSRRRWPRLLATAVVAVGAVVLIRRLLGDVDWAEVADGIGRLAWWEFGVLVAGLLVRQFLNALPLSLFIPECRPLRALQNDQAAIVMTTVAPPPSDLVLRVAMFRSWGIPATSGLAGTVMNSVAYYVVRFGAPLLGVLLMLALGDFHAGEFLTAAASGAVSIVLLVLLWVAFRREPFAARLARRAGGVAGRLNKSVDPEVWSEWAIEFRGSAVTRFPWAFPWSLVALAGMIVTDAALLMLSIRFVSAAPLSFSVVDALVAFLIAYPLTLFPFAGLGILDAAVVAVLLDANASVDEEALLAGFVVWRAVTIIGPELLGLLSLALWRLEQRVQRPRPVPPKARSAESSSGPDIDRSG